MGAEGHCRPALAAVFLPVNVTSGQQKLFMNSGQNLGRMSPGSQTMRLFPPENRLQ